MENPKELSLQEIRNYMLKNNCKVTNHALVKYFKPFLTNPDTQNEARKQFKTFVNVLATIKNENNQKYLILRKKYVDKSPEDDVSLNSSTKDSDSFLATETNANDTLCSETEEISTNRQPPPYKPPPEIGISPKAVTTPPIPQTESSEFQTQEVSEQERDLDQPGKSKDVKIDALDCLRKDSSNEKENNTKENVPRFSFSSGTSVNSTDSASSEKLDDVDNNNPISVKEATRKFNRMASEEEAKIISPKSKNNKQEKERVEEKSVPEVTLSHLKAKEWIVAMAKADYQELSKLAKESPELVKLQDPATGYTALHWGAKHGNEDIIKLIAGHYKGDVNARTNGGYTPLHLAMQFGRSDVFELLCNVYKANRDLMDWSGFKPLEYSKHRTSVSDLTYSSKYEKYIEVLSETNQNEIDNTSGIRGGGGTFSAGFSRHKNRSRLANTELSRTQSLMMPSKKAHQQNRNSTDNLKKLQKSQLY